MDKKEPRVDWPRLSPYQIGHKHAMNGIAYLTHRNGRLYDSSSANRSYQHGFSAGSRLPADGGLCKWCVEEQNEDRKEQDRG